MVDGPKFLEKRPVTNYPAGMEPPVPYRVIRGQTEVLILPLRHVVMSTTLPPPYGGAPLTEDTAAVAEFPNGQQVTAGNTKGDEDSA